MEDGPARNEVVSTTAGAAQLDADPPSGYLGANATVQSDHPDVVALGRQLRDEFPIDTDFARAAFEWVRDNIAHSYDARDRRVTLTASQVLHERVGLCYAKSNLLAAVLRSQGIPTGLAYQRVSDREGGHVVHGLIAVYLNGSWHRQDPRGNRPGVDAQFSLGPEQLAFPVDENQGERDYPRLYEAPPQEIVEALMDADDILACPLPSDLR